MTMVIPPEIQQAVQQAVSMLPAKFSSDKALVQLYATGLQESRFAHREQIGGPARGFWQFEKGGGVKGVLEHDASAKLAADICEARGVAATKDAVYAALSSDDVLAAAFARLLYWTDPKALPDVGDVSGAWDLYSRTWRPGKPHPETWAECYATALKAV